MAQSVLIVFLETLNNVSGSVARSDAHPLGIQKVMDSIL